ncbi:MAG TPA: MaoC/PaaZ C-terminal domain-containing protein [Chloroflexaceae bacterium]|nr:MaoC/PaaZ C-terminal domain-containing protein [Chloroflexaceae bacterium]
MLAHGDSFTFERTLTQGDFDAFAALSGDDNPIHVNPAFAARTRFGRTVSHGMLLYGLLCAALAEAAPGAAHLAQELVFPAPTYAGEPLRIALRAAEVDAEARRALVEATVTRPDGEMVCRGATTLSWSE